MQLRSLGHSLGLSADQVDVTSTQAIGLPAPLIRKNPTTASRSHLQPMDAALLDSAHAERSRQQPAQAADDMPPIILRTQPMDGLALTSEM